MSGAPGRTGGAGATTAPGPPTSRRAGLLVPLAVVLAVVAVLAVATWSLTFATRAERAVGPGQVAVGEGVAQVDAVVAAARPGMAMPGMGQDDDPVAEGMRRVSVEVTLLATRDEPLEFAVADFRLQVPGADPVAPHRSILPESVLPSGTQLSGTLIFEVSNEATTGELTYDGSAGTVVDLPLEEQGDHQPMPSDGGDMGGMEGMDGMGSTGGATEPAPDPHSTPTSSAPAPAP